MATAKAAAERALLSSIPDHVMKELRAHAAAAKLEAEQLNVSVMGPTCAPRGPCDCVGAHWHPDAFR